MWVLEKLRRAIGKVEALYMGEEDGKNFTEGGLTGTKLVREGGGEKVQSFDRSLADKEVTGQINSKFLEVLNHS